MSAAERAEVEHPGLFGPGERMYFGVASNVAQPNDLARVVHRQGFGCGAAQCSEIGSWEFRHTPRWVRASDRRGGRRRLAAYCINAGTAGSDKQKQEGNGDPEWWCEHRIRTTPTTAFLAKCIFPPNWAQLYLSAAQLADRVRMTTGDDDDGRRRRGLQLFMPPSASSWPVIPPWSQVWRHARRNFHQKRVYVRERKCAAQRQLFSASTGSLERQAPPPAAP